MESSSEEFDRRIGETVLGRYTLGSMLGVGAQGAVYRATDAQAGREVAVKILLEQAERDPTARQRMEREAQALSALAGTAAVQIYDQGFTRDGRFLLVQELLVGNDLETELARVAEAGGRFGPADVPFLFEPIVATLERAHALDIVHRDLKPANLFLEKRGALIRVRMLDFGFAKFRNKAALTVDGFVAGSPSYIAPETWRQLPVTPSVDVYALGAVIFRVLAGRPPFVAPSLVAIMRAVAHGERPSLAALRPDLPPSVDDWVRKALAIAAEDRYPTPRASYAAICAILGVPS